MAYPPEIWLMILEYVAEHDHSEDPWLWQIRLASRQLDMLARSLIWKHLKLSLSAKTTRELPSPCTLGQVVDYAVDSCCTGLTVGRFAETIDGELMEVNQYDRLITTAITDRELQMADFVLEALELCVKASIFHGRFDAWNHITHARAELCCYNLCRDRLSILTRGLLAFMTSVHPVDRYKPLITAQLAQEFQGYTVAGYYTNEVCSRNIAQLANQVERNKHFVQRLEVIVDGALEADLSEVKMDYSAVARTLYDCPALQTLSLRNDFPFAFPIAIVSVIHEDQGPGIAIIAKRDRRDIGLLEFERNPELHLHSGTFSHHLTSVTDLHLTQLRLERSDIQPFGNIDKLACLKQLLMGITIMPRRLRFPESLERLALFSSLEYSRSQVMIDAQNLRALEVDRNEMVIDWTFDCPRLAHLTVWDQTTAPFVRPTGRTPFPGLETLQLYLFGPARMKQMVQFYKPQQFELYGFAGHVPEEPFRCEPVFENWSEMPYIPPSISLLIDPKYAPTDITHVIKQLLAVHSEVYVHIVGSVNLDDVLGLSGYMRYVRRTRVEEDISCYRVEPKFATVALPANR